jgi:thioredoxin-related protein
MYGKPKIGAPMRLLGLILSWIVAGWVHAQDGEGIPFVRDFQAEAQAAEERRVPLLVLFSRSDCPYCDRVLNEFLVPMQRNPEYRSRVIMRQIGVGDAAPLRDFAGKATTHERFAATHRIKLVPTIKLFDPRGRELTEPLVGLSTPDYYGGFLDQRIDEALARMRAERRGE